MPAPNDILDLAIKKVSEDVNSSYIVNSEQSQRVDYICHVWNRSGVRALMACLLAKLHRPEVDIRKPYTEIGDDDSYSGRRYDERFIAEFIVAHDLPCNRTTAFLTPAFRNHDEMLTRYTSMVGTPQKLYENFLVLLDDVAKERVSPEKLLLEILRQLILLRDERNLRLSSQLASQQESDHSLLTVESIVSILQSHLSQRYSSRLPVLAIYAIYKTIESQLNERIVPLQAHNAADSQTDSLGDIEIAMRESEDVTTVYEMKTRKVTRDDFSQAIQKLASRRVAVKQYLFISTEPISDDIEDYARELNESQFGVEFAVLDCLTFIRYFLHLFYQVRIAFLDNYQEMVLAEPDSAIRFALKDVLLSLRQSAETVE